MTAIDATKRLRLDIERDPATGELVNLIQNPSGDLGGWGWITPIVGSTMGAGTGELAYVGVASTANNFTSELAPVTAGNFVAASWTNPFHTNSGLARARLVWYDATGAVVSSGTQGAYQTAAGSYFISATVVPATVTQVALRFDLYSTTAAANPTSTTRSLWLSDVTMATATTAAALLQTRTNLVTNPSFEVNTTGWSASSSTLARTTAQASVGTASCQITSTPDVVTNLCPNPSFESNTTGWAAGSGTASIARVSGGNSGSFSLQGTTGSIALHASATAYANGPVMTGVTAGQTYYFTYAMFHDPPGSRLISANARAILRWFNSSGTQIGADVVHGDAGLGTTSWLARSFTAAAPAGADRAQLFPGINWSFDAAFDSSTSTTTVFRVDGVSMLSANAGYFDGNTTDTGTYQYDWTGTANNSTSTRMTVVATAAAKTVSIAVSPGVTYAASAAFRAASTTRTTSISFQWRNGAGATLSTTTVVTGSDSASAWTRYGATAVAPTGAASVLVSFGANVGTFSATEVHYVDAVLIEASTFVDTYFDGSTTDTGSFTYDWTGTANASTSTAASTANNLVDLPPAYYVSIIAQSAALNIDRPELNLSTLTGTVVSASLDPSESTLLRPKRRCRVLVDVTGSGGWEPIFTGRLQKANVEYHLLEVDDERRSVITLTAVDPLTRLAQEPRPNGVGTIAELPFVLEGCGVPWNVNGSGNQVPTATVVASNDQATAVDQIAVTRDSKSGYAWIDRKGVVQVWDAASISTTVAATLSETDYTTDFGISYATDRVVNSVSIDSYEVNPATGETAVASYGPYRDTALQPGDDVYDKTFTVQGLTPAAIVTLANGILAANKTPTRRIDYVVLPITVETIGRALLDLYDLVTVVNARAGLSDSLRVIHVTHTITATQTGTQWLLRLDFTGDDTVASPQLIPQPSTGSGATWVDTLAAFRVGPLLYQIGAVNISVTAASTATAAVTFPIAFTGTPAVFLTIRNRVADYVASLTATATTTGFGAQVRHVDATVQTATVSVQWMAIGVA